MSRLNLQLPAKTVDGMQGAIGAELESLRRGHDEARAERARMIDSERDRRLRLSELEGGRTMLRQFLWTLAQPQIAAIMPLLSHEQGAALMEIVADVTTIPILEAYRDSAGRCPESAPLSARPCTRAAGHAGPHACPPQGSAGRPGTFTDHTASEFCAAADVEVRVRCEGQDGHGCPDDATLKLRVPLTQCEDGTLALEASEVANCCVSGVWPMHSAGKRRVCPRCAR